MGGRYTQKGEGECDGGEMRIRMMRICAALTECSRYPTCSFVLSS